MSSFSVVPDGSVHVGLANGAVGASLQPLVDATLVKDVATGQASAAGAKLEIFEAHHAGALRHVAARRPRKLLDLLDGLREQASSCIHHLL